MDDPYSPIPESSRLVVGKGSIPADLMVIGEAPGSMEEKLGIPFVGRSGKVLIELMNSAGIDLENRGYITNVIKCRPPNNRRPTKDEIKYSMPWLNQQIKLVDPKIILLLGSTAIDAVLAVKQPITKIRGKWHRLEERLVMPLFHPSYLLRNPSNLKGKPKFLTFMDLLEVKQKLED